MVAPKGLILGRELWCMCWAGGKERQRSRTGSAMGVSVPCRKRGVRRSVMRGTKWRRTLGPLGEEREKGMTKPKGASGYWARRNSCGPVASTKTSWSCEDQGGAGWHRGSPSLVACTEKEWGSEGISLLFQAEAWKSASPPLRRAEPQDALLGSVTLQSTQEPPAHESPLSWTTSFTGTPSWETETCAGQHYTTCKSSVKLFEKHALKQPWGAAREITTPPLFLFP